MFSSVKTRILLILIAMSLLSAASVGVGLLAFNTIQKHFAEITSERVPEIGGTMRLILSTGHLTNQLMEMNAAENRAQLDGKHGAATEQVVLISEQLTALAPNIQIEFSQLMEAVASDIETLQKKRLQEFAANDQLNSTMAFLGRAGGDASQRIKPLVDQAVASLQLGGEATISAVETTLSSLVDDQFKTVTDVLQIRSEINLLAGISLAKSTITDPGRLSILNDIGTSSSKTMMEILPLLEGNDDLAGYTPQIRDAAEFYSNIFLKTDGVSRVAKGKYLSIRQQADSALSGAIDDLVFTLTISAADAVDGNRTAIQDLMDVQVKNIREMLVLDAALQEFISVAMLVALSEDEQALAAAQERLKAAHSRLDAAMIEDVSSITKIVQQLFSASDTNGGVASQRRASMLAARESSQFGAKAISGVQAMANEAGALGLESLEKVGASGVNLSSLIVADKSRMYFILGVVVTVLIGAMIATQSLLIRPLSTLTQTTERLAQGDMAPIEGFDGRKDEIGRMGHALAVFRENSLKHNELDKANKLREVEEQNNRRAMFNLLASEIGSVVSSASAGDFSKRVEKKFDDAELAELSNDLNSLMDTTELGLDETRIALKAMAAADLTHCMAGDFQGIFSELADDVNETTRNLSGLVGKIRESATSSSGSAIELTNGAQKLASRAEQQAATLEETASAIEEMSEIAKSSSESLTEAEILSNQVAEKTEVGSTAATAAVENVQLIQESSSKIYEIISVIENISFQTNLLALNAAVEAARAGDAGKGFAVVASEVRALAQRSTDAASEISNLIRESTERVTQGVKSVEAAKSSFNDIDGSVRPVIELLSQIANSVREQATGVGEISQAVNRMDEMTQENAQMADMSTSMAGQLSKEISDLSDLAGTFKIENAPGEPTKQKNESHQQDILGDEVAA